MLSLKYFTLKELITHRMEIIANTSLRQTDPANQLNQLKQNYELLQEAYLPHRREFPSLLRHYIEQQSYLKALDFLIEAQNAPNREKSDP